MSCFNRLITKFALLNRSKLAFLSLWLYLPFPALANSTNSSNFGVAIAFGLGFFAAIVLLLLFRKQLASTGSKQGGNDIISADDLYLFTHDPATNLPTAQQAQKVFARALMQSNERRFAVVTIKPTNFQRVNSILGHHNSDILLLQLAYSLSQKLADNQSLLNFSNEHKPIRLARMQSLHFLMVVDLNQAQHDDHHILDDICQQLAASVPQAMSFKSFSLNFELAFGIAISGHNGHSVPELISHAEDALLSAIQKQKQIYYFDNASLLHTQQQLFRMELIHQDIRDEKLFWYVQPQINIANNHLVGFQIKVHWYEQAEKPKELADFVRIAEYSGDIYLLTKQMIIEAFKVMAVLNKQGLEQPVAISILSQSLLEADLVDFIEGQIKRSGVSGKQLIMELAEDVIVDSAEQAKRTIDQLKSLGVRVAIDNFSGSYESLRYLRKTAVQQIKINCQHLRNDSENRVDKAITNALVTLSRSMKIQLIGTHIDSHEASAAYKAMGGELMQGMIINRGVVRDELDIWLNAWFSQHPEAKPN